MADPGGVLVAGPPGAVESAVERLVAMAGAGARTLPTVADLSTIGASVAATVSTHGQYVKLAPRSMRLLQEHGRVPSGDGSFWAFVRGRQGITGVLDFAPVDLGPEQLLSLQTAAIALALRAAINEVQDAVDRVGRKLTRDEGPVDQMPQLPSMDGAPPSGTADATGDS